jgi:hypothetical protein
MLSSLLSSHDRIEDRLGCFVTRSHGGVRRGGQRRQLKRRLEALENPVVTFDAKRLRHAVEEWREVLGRQVPQARQIVSKLLASKLTFAPEDRDGRRGFRFRATGTVEKLVAGTVRVVCKRWYPQRDSNPCCRLERAESWSTRRWGRDAGRCRTQPAVRLA